MAFDRKEMAKNLQLLDSIPKEIERQQQAYRARLAEIRGEEQRQIWGKATLDKWRKEAREERDRTCSALAKRMRPALDYVASNNDYAASETIDFSNPRLKDAMRTVELMGRDLSAADQLAMINSFRGDPASLRALEVIFRKNGLYFHTAAKELQKTIPQQALDEMRYVLDSQQYHEAAHGTFEWPIEKATWTKAAFRKQAERLGLEDTTDPYSAILEAAADNIRANRDAVAFASDMDDTQKSLAKARYESQLYKLQSVQKEMQEAQARGQNPAAILNRELAKLEVPAQESAQ